MASFARHVFAHCTALLTLSVSIAAHGAPAKLVAAAPPAAATPPAARVDVTLPPAPMTLRLTAGASGRKWQLQVHNSGEGPVRIPADIRLLALELAPAGADAETTDKTDKKRAAGTPAPVRCILPDDARPANDEGPDLVIPAGRSWSANFDPLFYCFGAKERAALVTGTSVKARFGWPTKNAARTTAPFVVNPVGASVDKTSPVKEIEAAPITLTESVVDANPGVITRDEALATGKVALTVPQTLDASRGSELSTTVTLWNGESSPITLLFRPEFLLFNVQGPNGSVACGTPKQVAAPIRELFTTIGARGRGDMTILFSAICPAGTFDEAGVYRVLPSLDTSGASGRRIRLRTWEGVAIATSPLLVRIRTPRQFIPPPRPILD